MLLLRRYMLTEIIEIESLLEKNEILKALEKLHLCALDLNETDISNWSNSELNGFYGEIVPIYRTIAGVYHDQYGRPLVITNPKLQSISEYRLKHPFAQLHEMTLQGHRRLAVSDPVFLQIIKEELGVDVVSFNFSPTNLSPIISKVRMECLKSTRKLKKLVTNPTLEIVNSSMFSNLHPKIRNASEQLFKDGHFRQAVLDAYILLTNEVKIKSNSNKDGVPLMQTSFSQNNPILKVSDHPDEQLGFMWLFSGAVMGIRNPKAHNLIPQTSPHKAYEWLSFASVLLKILDDSQLQS